MDEATSREIEKVTWNTLRDAGIVRPPVQIEVILQHLHLYRDFYSLKNPSFLDRTKHKIRVHGTKLVNILQKINLMAVLFYDENRIVVDEELPEIRQDWPSFHEVSHKIFVWHKPYFYGDTAQTLDPDWHEILESEANYGASALMFCGHIFTKEACDTTKEWASVASLKKRYKKSLTTTLRRYVEHGHDHSMFMLVSTPYWCIKPEDQTKQWRHFVRSKMFSEQFSTVAAEDVLKAVDSNSSIRIGGPVADFTFSLNDDNGVLHEFRAESFYNRYYLLTLCVQLKKCTEKRIVMPKVVYL